MAGRVRRASGTRRAAACEGPPVGDAPTDQPEKEEAPLRPGQCRAYMRAMVAKEFRGIVRGFVESAKTGSCQHVKLATELVAAPVRVRSRGKSTVELLLEKIDREVG